MTKLAEILTGPETWCQNAWHNSAGERCLLGALAALVGSEDSDRFIHEVARLGKLIGVGGVPEIIAWNNAPGRTWEEIQTVRDDYDRDRMLNP